VSRPSKHPRSRKGFAKLIFYLYNGGIGNRGDIEALANGLATAILLEDYKYTPKELVKLSGYSRPEAKKRLLAYLTQFVEEV